MPRLFKQISSLISTTTLTLGLLAAIPLTLSFPSAANAAACAAGATSGVYTVSPSHGEVFYIDTGVTPRLDAAYVGYKIRTSSAKSNLWVKLSSFTGGQITLANSNDELQQIPTLAAGAGNEKTAFFLLKASGTATTTNQTHTMTLYEGNPNRGGTSVYTCDFAFDEIQETIKASANKVQTISVPSNNPSLGSLVEVVVTGTTGQPGAGKNPDGDIIWVTPSGFSTWPTSALRLESTTLILDQDANFNTTNDQNTYNNQLLVTGIKTLTLGTSSSKLNSSSQYKATYRFRVIGPSTSTFKVAPVAQISSGGQYKHSDTNSTATGTFPTIDLRAVSSTMTVTKKISPIARISNKALTSNVATLTTSEAHGLSQNDTIYVTDLGSPFDGAFTVSSVPSNTTFTYAVTNADISSTVVSTNSFVFLRNGTSNAIIPYEVIVTSTGTTTVDEIVDTPDSGLTFVTGSGTFKDVDRTSFTAIADPVNDSTESALSPRPKHFTGPFNASASTNVILRYKMSAPTSSTASYTNLLYAKAGNQIVGASTSANPKIVVNTTSGGVSGVSETTNAAPPTVSTEALISLGSTTATLAGITDPNGNSVAIKFQWGTSSTLATSTDATASTTSSSSADPVNISSDLTGLTANTTYYYRAVITYGSSTVLNGEILSFKTNLIGSTSQAITWATTFPTYDLNSTSSTTQNTTIAQSGTSTGLFTGGNVFSNSGLFVDVTSSTTNVCTVTTSSTYDTANPPNETSVVYTINFLTTGTCTLVASQAGNATYAAATSITKNISIVALYTVTFNGNSNTGGSASVSSVTQASSGSSVTLAGVGTLARTNYTFGGWNTLADGTGTNYNASATYTPTGNITLYAKWNLDTYDVTYNGNSNMGGSTPANQTKTHGVDLTLQSNSGTLVRTGYTFDGWYTTSTGTGGTAFAVGATYSTNAAVTLYAKWAPATFTLTYDGNSADSGTAPSSTTYTTGSTAITVAGNTGTLVKSGYTFHGWYSNTTGTGGTSYSSGSSLTISSNTTVYAHWIVAGAKTVTFDKNDSSGTTGSQSASTATALSSSSAVRTRTGYTFAGWNTLANGNGTNYAEGASYDFSADITLYAKWTADTYSITYDANSSTSGSVPSNQTKTYDVNLTLQTNTGTLARTGYTFAGWNTQANGSGTSYSSGASYTTNANLTLYAKWTINTYTVTYDGNGETSGSVPVDGSSPYNYNSTVTVLGNSGNLAKTGYTFAGWNTVANGTGTSQAAASTFTLGATNVTLYAQWTADTPTSYTITYATNNSDGGSAPANTTGNGSVTLRTNSGNLTRSGYTFGGWNTATGCSGTNYSAGASFNLTSSVTLYPCWNANSAPAPEPQPAPAPAPKVKPVIEWKNPNAIKTTTTLSTTQLNAIAKPSTASSNGIAGRYVYTPIVPTVVTSGSTQVTTITSAQTALTGITKTVDSTTPSTPTTPSSVTEKPVLGQGTTLAPGLQKMKVVFIPADSTTYEPVETEVEILVQAETKVEWVDPAPIKKTTPVGPGQLNATGIAPGLSNNVPGTYKYDIPEGTTLPPGKYPVKVTFTPNDPNYLPSTGEVVITVIADINPLATPIITPSNTPAGKPITNTTAAANAKVTTVGKGLTTATTDGTQVNIVPLVNFSGKTTVTVSVTDEGETKDVVVPVTVLPLPAATPVATPNTKGKSTIAWKPSPNAVEYEVSLGGKSICTTSATSCSTAALIGPKSDVKIVAKGNDETVAPVAQAKYTAPKKPVTALVVYFDTNKFNLDAKDRADIRAVAKIIIEQGFKNIVVNGHTDLRGGVDNQVLSRNRSNATFNYLKELVPGLNVTIGAFASTKPAVKGTSAEALASNRRAEVGVF